MRSVPFGALKRSCWLGIFLAFALWLAGLDEIQEGVKSGYSREVGVVEVVS